MKVSEQKQRLLKQLPGVDRLLLEAQKSHQDDTVPKAILLRAIRDTLAQQRERILDDSGNGNQDAVGLTELMAEIACQANQLLEFNLKRTINATGVVVHTNLGRSCLAPAAIDHVISVARHYSNLEFDLSSGRRGSRYSVVETVLCELTGAESALVVNNNAGAVLLCLDTLARQREVVLSRGEMVEIGGAFRIPDVMAKSGARLKEVGTTNRTHLRDYENAIGTDTGLLMKVHTSNYSIVGFTAAVSLEDLVALGNKFNLPVMEDLGSGNFIDLTGQGLQSEPTVQASVAAGVDVISFSGDKLLGGPQAGLIVGRKKIVDRIKSNPLTRALRVDKLTLAALEATLHLYRDTTQAIEKIPTLRMLTAQRTEIAQRANQIKQGLERIDHQRLKVELLNFSSRAGGGALPLLDLPSCCVGVSVTGLSANTVEKTMRQGQPAIVGRIENDQFIMDPRTIDESEIELIISAFDRLLTSTTDNSKGSAPN